MNNFFSKFFSFFKKEEIKNQDKIQETYTKKEYDEIYSLYQYNKEKFEMLDKILSAKKLKNKNFEVYEKVFNEEFLPFANNENSLSEEAEVTIEFQNLREELIKIINFNFLYTKNIIAIGGGFSAGKSEFLNVLLSNTDLRLPVGINPVTAIPTYIVNSKKEQVMAFSSNGGRTEFDFKSYEKLSHDYMKGFSFNLKEILPFIMIQTKIDELKYKNICFVDTPGYNPGNKEKDREASFENVRTANTIIWLVPASAGTIHQSDINFLNEIGIENKKLYIVLSKADEKPKSQLEEIMDTIEEVLDDEDIEIEGISAYSSRKKEEYIFRKKSLFEFIDEQDVPISSEQKIKAKIDSIMDKYIFAITKEITKSKEIRKKINNLHLGLIELSMEATEKISNDLIILKNKFRIEELEESLLQAENIKLSFNKAISKIFDEISSEKNNM